MHKLRKKLNLDMLEENSRDLNLTILKYKNRGSTMIDATQFPPEPFFEW